MKIENIIKELTDICENVYELHNLIICNKLFNLNKDIKPHISRQLFLNYNKELENLFFESFINETKINDIKIIINDIIYLISQIISSLNKLLLNYP
jgi:hypothetical protein